MYLIEKIKSGLTTCITVLIWFVLPFVLAFFLAGNVLWSWGGYIIEMAGYHWVVAMPILASLILGFSLLLALLAGIWCYYSLRNRVNSGLHISG